MVDQQLIQYVQQQLQKGFSAAQVRTFLVSHGYNASDVDSAINSSIKDRLNSLVSYIKGELAKGFKAQDIRIRLKQFGYAPGDIDAAMSQAQGTPIGAMIFLLIIILAIGGIVWFFAFREAPLTPSDQFDYYDEFPEEPPIEELPVEESPINKTIPGKSTVKEEPLINETAHEEPQINETIAEEPSAEEPPVEEPQINETIVEGPLVEEPLVEEPVKKPPKELQGAVKDEDVQRAADICLKSENAIYRDACFDQVSKAANNPEFCENIGNTQMHDDCIIRFVLKDDDYGLCEKITDVINHDLCISLSP